MGIGFVCSEWFHVIRDRIMSSSWDDGEEGNVCTRMYGKGLGRKY